MNKEKILIACSGGPDSMALLDMYKNKKKVFVCHINYHQRKTAKRDENIVKNYCKKWNIPFYKFDYKNIKKGNFQKLARDFRYDCFKKVCKQNNIKTVYVAHQMDDNIETYLMQVNRKTGVDCYGISKKITIDGVNIYRPLLNKTKLQLVDYLNKKGIEYGIDESNNTNKYERNRVRHNIVDKMSYEQKIKTISEIKNINKKLSKNIQETKRFIQTHKQFTYKSFINYKYFDLLLRELLYKDMSAKYINEIKKALSNKNSIELLVKDKVICKEYGHVSVYVRPSKYSYSFNKIVKRSFDYFKISKNGTSKEGVTISKSDFPIVIRNYEKGDEIIMKYGTKKINRFFIDNKIPSLDRKVWPIVLNKKGEVILVPGLGCNKTHYSKNHTFYVLKLSLYEG